MKRDEYLLDRLATDLRLAGKAERTVEAYSGAVRRLGRVCGKALAAIDEALAFGGRRRNPIVESQIRRILTSLSVDGDIEEWRRRLFERLDQPPSQ